MNKDKKLDYTILSLIIGAFILFIGFILGLVYLFNEVIIVLKAASL